MERVGASQNQVKQATAWVAEKASRREARRDHRRRDDDYGCSCRSRRSALGVAGKLCLWEALKQQAADHEGLDPSELAVAC